MKADPLNIAAEQRPLALRLRTDLHRSALSLAGVEYQVLHDPTTGKHFQLRWEEFAILSQLRGSASLSDLQQYFAEHFAPRKIGAQRLQAFLAQAYRGGLLISEYAEQGQSLWQRAQAERGRRLLSGLMSIFQWRIWRFDPRQLLDWVSPLLLPLYSRIAVGIWLTGLLWMCWVVFSHRHALLAELPQISTWLRVEHFPLLVVSLWIAKSWHELGHAIACRRWEVRCREMGVQLLFGVPCLYCDTTESWQLANKWQRMMISAGGLYFEGYLAALSAVVYYFTAPGLLHDLSLHLMFVCTIGTFLINANPLLRFDGYYLLSDGLEVANLEARARAHARAVAEWLCFGSDLRVLGPFENHLDLRLALFGCVMFVYRILLLIGLMWGLRLALVPNKLAPLAEVISVLLVVSFAMPFILEVKREREPFSSEERQRTLVQMLLPLFAVIAAFVCWVPLPASVRIPAVLEPAMKQAVYATVPGRVRETVANGQRIKSGERIAWLENQELKWELESLQALEVEQELLLQQAEASLLIDRATAASQIPIAQAALQSIQERRQTLQENIDRLEITAPQAGIVVAPQPRSKPKSTRELGTWSGSPLELDNRGAYLETGTLLCHVAEENSFTVTALIDQADAVRVQPGSRVVIQCSAIAPAITGELLEVARIAAETMPAGLRSLQSAIRKDHRGVQYLARVRVMDPLPGLAIGMKCQLRITALPETLFAKWQRWYERTIRFEVTSSRTR